MIKRTPCVKNLAGLPQGSSWPLKNLKYIICRIKNPNETKLKRIVSAFPQLVRGERANMIKTTPYVKNPAGIAAGFFICRYPCREWK